MKGQSLKALVESEGKQAVAGKVISLLADGKIKPADVSVRELWESFVGPCGQTLRYAQRGSGLIQLAEAAVDSTAFAGITGQVLMSRALEEYNQPGYIGDMLFDTVPSSRRSERMPGFTLEDQTAGVPEGMPYPEGGMQDRYVTVESGNKRGLILSLTEEAIFLDETGALLRSARNIGQFVRKEREDRMLSVFTGTTTNYYPAGVQTTIYSSDNSNLIADNALEDWTDVDTALQTLAAQTDANGQVILVVPRMVVVPFALAATGNRIVNATTVEKRTNSAADVAIGANPIQQMLGLVPQVVTSPLLDAYDDGDEWYLGDPKRGFVYRQHWPFQSFEQGATSEQAFERDIVLRLKFREWGTAHCVDHRPVVKNAVT